MDIRRSPANFKLNTIWQFYEGGEADGWSEPIFSTSSWQDTPSENSCRTSLSEASMQFLRCVLRLIPRCQVDHSVTEMMACWRIASFQTEIVQGILKRLPFQWTKQFKVYTLGWKSTNCTQRATKYGYQAFTCKLQIKYHLAILRRRWSWWLKWTHLLNMFLTGHTQREELPNLA